MKLPRTTVWWVIFKLKPVPHYHISPPQNTRQSVLKLWREKYAANPQSFVIGKIVTTFHTPGELK